jgi:NAD+-dependent protein deacetylase SIR2
VKATARRLVLDTFDARSNLCVTYCPDLVQVLGLSCPEELFDFDVFLDNPQPFFKFARNLYYPLGGSAPARPSDSHKLLALLEERRKLLRVYSQNIDGLEEEAGVSAKKIVYAHGSLQHATCCKCKRKVPSDEIRDDIWNGEVARCRAVAPAPKGRGKSGAASSSDGPSSTASPVPVVASRSSARKRLREAGEPSQPPSSSEAGLCGGIMKPGVTFFGEHLNDSVRRCLEVDRDKVDALIVMGTSLSVYVSIAPKQN